MRAVARRGASLARRLGLVSSPLRRTTDRIEGWIRVGLVATFLVSAPLAAVGTGQWAASSMTRTAQQQSADGHYVMATLLEAVPSASANDTAHGALSWVRARWTAPDGSVRTGQVQAPLGAHTGSTIRVWTDGQGHLAGEPLTHGEIVGRVTTVVFLTVVVLLLLVLAIIGVAHQFLERRRMADWEQSWSRVEPQWNRRRR